jgi:hypothetical protein
MNNIRVAPSGAPGSYTVTRDPQSFEEGRQRFALSRQIDVQNSTDSAGFVKFQMLLASMCEGVATMRKMIQERDQCSCGR